MKKEIDQILKERFGKDSLIAIATTDEDGKPWVRTVDAYYEDGSFYTITYLLSNKMKHISKNKFIAICGEWFSGHAEGYNLGYIKLLENEEIANKLRKAFAAWYDNGHTNEDDPNTIILKITVTDGILFSHGERYTF